MEHELSEQELYTLPMFGLIGLPTTTGLIVVDGDAVESIAPAPEGSLVRVRGTAGAYLVELPVPMTARLISYARARRPLDTSGVPSPFRRAFGAEHA